jgi:hypothetical protein
MFRPEIVQPYFSLPRQECYFQQVCAYANKAKLSNREILKTNWPSRSPNANSDSEKNSNSSDF